MRILLAPNAFKESLSALEFNRLFSEVARAERPEIEILSIPLADGGDGTLEVIHHLWQGTIEMVDSADPLRRPIRAPIGYSADRKTALVELPSTSGLVLLAPNERNPLKTTTLGVGLLIGEALKNGVQQILLCIGGSATVDGGSGMAEGLGFRHLNADGKPLPGCGGNLTEMTRISPPDMKVPFKTVVLSDVTNPLYGPNGAAVVFGPQKGASPEMVKELDEGLRNLADLWERDLGKKVADLPGSGAAGGIGGGAMAYLDAELVSGGDWILKETCFEEKLATVDLVITGEGQLDTTTLQGKIPGKVALLAQKAGVPCLGLCGTFDENHLDDLLAGGFSEILPLAPKGTAPEESIRRAGLFLQQCAHTILERV